MMDIEKNNLSNEIRDEVKPSNILIVGTSHIAKTSVQEVKKSFLEFKPDVICIELDKNRIQSILSKEEKKGIPISAIKHIGVTGYLFALLAQYVQKKLGDSVGVMPGAEMKIAIHLAQTNQIPLALIDQDISITLSRLSKYFTYKEKFRMVSDMFLSAFSSKHRQFVGIDFDLDKVPKDEIIEKMIGYVEKRYPNIYKVLIHERNIVMVRRIRKIMLESPDKRIMVVVGAGHKKEMLEMLKNWALIRYYFYSLFVECNQ